MNTKSGFATELPVRNSVTEVVCSLDAVPLFCSAANPLGVPATPLYGIRIRYVSPPAVGLPGAYRLPLFVVQKALSIVGARGAIPSGPPRNAPEETVDPAAKLRGKVPTPLTP